MALKNANQRKRYFANLKQNQSTVQRSQKKNSLTHLMVDNDGTIIRSKTRFQKRQSEFAEKRAKQFKQKKLSSILKKIQPDTVKATVKATILPIPSIGLDIDAEWKKKK